MGHVSRARDYLKFAAATVTGRQDPLIPPPWLHSIGGGDFREIGSEFLGHFVGLGGLKPTDRVLDVGCGTGRMALPLTNFLAGGSYEGFDIVKRSIDWCRKAYAAHPSFQFHHADIYNGNYNKDGTLAACDYRFPDGPFDFVFLTSVFTHMLTNDVAHYLAEIGRVLAPGGRVLMTAYLVGKGGPAPCYSFAHRFGECYSEFVDNPEWVTGYRETDFRRMAEAAGLEIRSVHLGTWRGGEGLSWQDIIIAGPSTSAKTSP